MFWLKIPALVVKNIAGYVLEPKTRGIVATNMAAGGSNFTQLEIVPESPSKYPVAPHLQVLESKLYKCSC